MLPKCFLGILSMLLNAFSMLLNAFSMPGDVTSMPGDCIWLRFFLASGGFFRSRMRFFVRINWKYAVLTIASYASRKIFQPWLNIVPKRWEKVKFQAVQNLLRWLFEFWSASAFCLQILLHLAPTQIFYFWIVFSVEVSSMFQQTFGPKLIFSYSIISFDEGSGLSKEIGGRSTKKR